VTEALGSRKVLMQITKVCLMITQCG